MQTVRALTLVFTCAVIALAGSLLHASDRVAVYAKVDRVVLAPDAQSPRTVQIFGTFSIAQPDNPNSYQPAARGYLYFTLAGDDALALREWNDLKDVAGTKQIVAFGSRSTLKARVRPATEAPTNPDPYKTGTGVAKINGNTDYAPIRAILDARR